MQHPTFAEYALFQVEDFLLDAYFQLWLTSDDPEVEAFWQRFMQNYPLQKETVEEARKLANSIHYQPYSLPKVKQDALLEKVYAKSGEASVPLSYSSQKRYLAVAASVSLLLVSALFWLFYPAYKTYETGYQESRTVQLADGSEVTLNANTRIRVAVDTDNNQPRQVWLEGEAYFKVRHLDDEQTARLPNLKSFVVHTDNFDIEVLGTVFNASNRDSRSEVMLKEGSVKVASKKIAQSQVLEPGDQLALFEEDRKFRVIKMEKPVAPAWRENIFIFKDAPLQQVAREIENYYGLEVEFTEPALAEKIFTAKVSREDLPTLLKAIEASFGVEVIQEGGTINIKN